MSTLPAFDPLPDQDLVTTTMALVHLGAGTLRNRIKEHDRGEIRLAERHIVQLAALAHDLHHCAERLAVIPPPPSNPDVAGVPPA